MQSLGADTMEEAMVIASAAGIQPEDIPQFMASQGMYMGGQQPSNGMSDGMPEQTLTRRQ